MVTKNVRHNQENLFKGVISQRSKSAPIEKSVEKITPAKVDPATLIKLFPSSNPDPVQVMPNEAKALLRTPWYARRFTDYEKYRQIGIQIAIPVNGPGRPFT